MQQLTLWDLPALPPEPEPVTVPDDYPWRYHERFCYHKANHVAPALAAVLAHEDVAREEARARWRESYRCPRLWGDDDRLRPR